VIGAVCFQLLLWLVVNVLQIEVALVHVELFHFYFFLALFSDQMCLPYLPHAHSRPTAGSADHDHGHLRNMGRVNSKHEEAVVRLGCSAQVLAQFQPSSHQLAACLISAPWTLWISSFLTARTVKMWASGTVRTLGRVA
jgi:hypothetical protein